MIARTLAVVALLAAPLTAAAETPQEKATRLLDDKGRGKAVILFAHFGADYSDHALVATGKVNDANGREKPGHFYLEYKYNWKVGDDRGTTSFYFFFDKNGVLNEIRVSKTDAVLNQPFAFANLGIKLLGQAVLEAAKNDLTDAQQKRLQKFVDDADAKGLLEFLLAIDLVASK
jgi:hypothetical protein